MSALKTKLFATLPVAYFYPCFSIKSSNNFKILKLRITILHVKEM